MPMPSRASARGSEPTMPTVRIDESQGNPMPEPVNSTASATQLQELLGRALPGALPTSIDRLVRQAHWQQVRAGRLLLKQEELLPFTAIVEGLVAFRRT